MYVFPKKKVTYRGGQVGDQAWKFSRHWVKAGRIGNPTGRNVKPSVSTVPIAKYCLWQWQFQLLVTDMHCFNGMLDILQYYQNNIFIYIFVDSNSVFETSPASASSIKVLDNLTSLRTVQILVCK